MKSNRLFINKGDYGVERLYYLIVVLFIVNSGMLNVGYSRTQNFKLLPLLSFEIPFYKTVFMDKGGDHIPVRTVSPLKPGPGFMQENPAYLISPTLHESQEIAPSLFDSVYSFSGNCKAMGYEDGQKSAKRKSADGFYSSKERLNFLWRHFLIGLALGLVLSGLAALSDYRRL